MLLNARKVFYEGTGHTTAFRAFEDIMERRRTQRALQSLFGAEEMLYLSEPRRRELASDHREHSPMKARTADRRRSAPSSGGPRRVMSVASVQQHLQASGKGEQIAVGPYLSKLCETLAASMIGDHRPISLNVVAPDGIMNSRPRRDLTSNSTV